MRPILADITLTFDDRAHLKKTVTYIRDPTIDAWRIGSADSFRKSMIMMYDDPDADEDDPDALMDTQVEDGITAAMKRGVSVPLASPRVPRPPNSFILYRQHHHHKVTAENPGVRNTEICESHLSHSIMTVLTHAARIIAQMWHGEGAAVRARFKDLAEEKKRLHSQAHPNYQYAPRRPGEKLRRQSPRIRASSVPFFNKTAAGQARLKNAEENDDGWIDVDGDCIDIFDELGLMYGPSALPPIPSYDSPDFHAIVDMQCGERVGLQTVHYENLDGTEFEPGFPMDTLLALPGA